jgi:hypothetical protein
MNKRVWISEIIYIDEKKNKSKACKLHRNSFKSPSLSKVRVASINLGDVNSPIKDLTKETKKYDSVFKLKTAKSKQASIKSKKKIRRSGSQENIRSKMNIAVNSQFKLISKSRSRLINSNHKSKNSRLKANYPSLPKPQITAEITTIHNERKKRLVDRSRSNLDLVLSDSKTSTSKNHEIQNG